MSTGQPNQQSLTGYYRWHARIYDLTRWAFLFGRRRLVQRAAGHVKKPGRILEIGCGTGKNLVHLAEAFPQAEVIGLDLSQDMLDRARPKMERFGKRVSLLHQAYDAPVAGEVKFDLIVFSYSLSMINPGYDEVLKICQQDLSPQGVVAVVDFHESRWAWFRRWMGVNHVRMEGQVLACLRRDFPALLCQVHHGYGDLWRYVLFLGRPVI
ncbi:S-adenosylmethionine-diacylgycerolhomoserine-N-methyltransferase [Prosthecobacter fusiformis]|uniref:S-adenosylmethionine-diacylgycerolhomoserine-N-methyltransferase n=1 Tax=Prosthecobacter fusiformis TaxID=48464 RepID=A0A4R7S5R2_9BACT|nr:methyltransferase domain-containing protein [Prosthecobacter fusiformis]TDU72878.1 S-adenosylmethionine-diacylgycerolhomoserine-N-methyltransferase [Prosthecobacter fusiformis]